MRTSKRVATLVFSLSALLGSTACSTSTAIPAKSPASASTSEVFQFNGPWAAELKNAYDSTQSDLARRVLATGAISDRDYAEIQEANITCLEENGLVDVEYLPQGELSIAAPDGMTEETVNAVMTSCATSSGLIDVEPLYIATRVNPNNEDFEALTVRCLLDKEIVDASFSVADLKAWFDNQDPRLASQAGKQCISDPLGLLNTG